MSLKKYKIIFEEFHSRGELDSYDERLRELLGGMSQKQIDRKLKEFESEFDNIILEKKGKKNIYRLMKPIDVFKTSFDNSTDIGWFLHMAHDGDPELFAGLEELTRKDRDMYLFRNTPFEDTNTIESSQNFQRLKRNIEAREYTKIKYLYDDTEYDNLKPIKLVFVDNNWYIATVDSENILRFGRISFIERVDYGSKTAQFQPTSVAKQREFLTSRLQNSMTLFDREPQIATIKATSAIARYFKPNMKKFLSSQKFVEELDDGSVIFTVQYTQELEILPFVQKWLPDLIILEPRELREAYIEKLQSGINNHKDKNGKDIN